MRESAGPGRKLYRLVARPGAGAAAHAVEFEADGPQEALFTAERLVGGGDVAIFEDGRPLVRVRRMHAAGGWMINPPQLGPGTV